MTDREKVIKGLECLITNKVPCDGCPYNEGENSSCLKNIARDAFELLKEQEPVKPKRDNTGILCGRCGQWIGTNDRFCSNCGRGVKWDD